MKYLAPNDSLQGMLTAHVGPAHRILLQQSGGAPIRNRLWPPRKRSGMRRKKTSGRTALPI
jgi:hypothetical protein